MFHRLTCTVPPAAAALTLDDVRPHLHEDSNDHAALIMDYIAAATAMIDGADGIGYCLHPQTWQLALPRFARRMPLPLRPVVSITSVTYLDADGATQTVASSAYRLALAGGAGAVEFKPGQTWPAVGDFEWPVTVTFVAGKGVPPRIKTALQMIVAGLFANRENQTTDPLHANPMVADMLEPYRNGWVVG